MSELYLYLLSFITQWWWAMGLPASVATVIAWKYPQKAISFVEYFSLRKPIGLASFCLAVFFSGFFAWKDNHVSLINANAELASAKESLNRTQRSPEWLYQNGHKVAQLPIRPRAAWGFDTIISETNELNFDNEIEFGDMVLRCLDYESQNFSMIANRITYTWNGVRCNVLRRRDNEVTR